MHFLWKLKMSLKIWISRMLTHQLPARNDEEFSGHDQQPDSYTFSMAVKDVINRYR